MRDCPSELNRLTSDSSTDSVTADDCVSITPSGGSQQVIHTVVTLRVIHTLSIFLRACVLGVLVYFILDVHVRII